MVNPSNRFPAKSRYAHVAGYSRRSFFGFGLGALAVLAGCSRSDDPVDGSRSQDSLAGDAQSSGSGGRSSPTLEVDVGQGGTTSNPDRGASALNDFRPNDGQVAPAVDDSTADGESGSSTTAPTADPDSSVSSASAETTAPTSQTTVTSATPTTATTASPTTATTAPETTRSATALPPGADLAISFTYTQTEGGKNVSPFIAVWMEDDTGELVETLALWFQQFGRGEKWLRDLRRWHSHADGVTTASGPTRPPGQFNVAWDGSAPSGQPLPSGRYYVCVESARERGPYSLVRTAIDLNGVAVNQQLGSDGELSSVSARTA